MIKIDGLTTKQRHQAVAERSQGLCELCYSPNMTQVHHIIKGKGKRKQFETIYSLIMLCWDCHHGINGVHGRDGHKLDLLLKQRLEKTYRDMGLSEEEIRYWMGGRLYV